MLKLLLTIYFSAIGFISLQERMIPVDKESQVKFSIKNFGLNVSGTVKGLEGSIQFDPNNLATSQMVVSVSAGTINTGNNARDSHLKKKDYFDTEKFPRIEFRSNSIVQGKNKGEFLVNGNLQIKGINKEINIPFKARKIEIGYEFTGSFPLNRQDFGVGGYSISLSDNLIVSLAIITK